MNLHHPAVSGYFITGSDTNVGKTHVACRIIDQIKSQVGTLKVRKPVESGCRCVDGQYFPADGDALYRSNALRENLDIITPFRYAAALAPNQAARKEHQSICLQQLYHAAMHNVNAGDFVIVEGAGGFFSPMAEDALNADLAVKLGFETVIVIADQLGAINQTLLTVAAVENAGLAIRAIVLNQLCATPDDNCDNLQEIRQRVDHMVIRCPYGQNEGEFQWRV